MRAGEIFCISCSFLFLPLGAFCVLPVCFGLAFEHPFLFLFIKFSVSLPNIYIYIYIDLKAI